MNKKLKFAQHLVPLVLNGTKTSTWRLWDDKNLQACDYVDFIEYGTQKHFASATLIEVVEKPLGLLTKEDKLGHETFANDEEMYETYTKYYGRTANKETVVKLVKFALIK